jgi:hypothetical protein
LTEYSALFAAMNPNTVTGSRRPWRRRPPLFQDLALLGEDAVLAAQPAQLVALVAAQALTAALIDVDLTGPVSERLRRDPQLRGELRDRLTAALEQLNRLTAELQRIRRRHEH